MRTILVAGVGTIVGAWVTSRSQTKRRILDELRAITAARALCFSVTNRAMGLKRRHVRPLKQRFEQALINFQNRRAGAVVEIMLDMNELSRVKFPDAVLERVVL